MDSQSNVIEVGHSQQVGVYSKGLGVLEGLNNRDLKRHDMTYFYIDVYVSVVDNNMQWNVT